MGFSIKDIDFVLGEERIDLSKYGTDFDRLVNATGIPAVYRSSKSAIDLAEKSARKVLDRNRVKIDALVMVTQSPNDFLPANSCTLHDRLKLPASVLTFDYNQGCSGFVQSLFVLHHLLSTFNHILIVCADVYRSKLRPGDRSTEAVFSDGSAAILLSSEPRLEIMSARHFTQGDRRSLLYQSVKSNENDGYLYMAGREIWIFTKKYVVPQLLEVINDVGTNQVKNIFIHQASKVVVEGIAQQMPRSELVRQNYQEVGNTVSSSVPILMKDYLNDLYSGINILSGFGVGLTSSTIALRPINNR